MSHPLLTAGHLRVQSSAIITVPACEAPSAFAISKAGPHPWILVCSPSMYHRSHGGSTPCLTCSTKGGSVCFEGPSWKMMRPGKRARDKLRAAVAYWAAGRSNECRVLQGCESKPSVHQSLRYQVSAIL